MGKSKISISIIGEGETEWFYFDSLRRSKRYSFSIQPDFPQHSDINHIIKLVNKAILVEYDYIFCLLDMDRINTIPKEKKLYEEYKNKRNIKNKVVFIETMPCTEFWFLLHFIEHCSTKLYHNYQSLLPELKKYFIDYEKTKKFFRKNNLYDFLRNYGDVERAKSHAKQLAEIRKNIPGDMTISYSDIYLILEKLDKLDNMT